MDIAVVAQRVNIEQALVI